MKKMLLAAFAVLFLFAVSAAQDNPKADIAAGYWFLWSGKGFTFFMNGGIVGFPALTRWAKFSRAYSAGR